MRVDALGRARLCRPTNGSLASSQMRAPCSFMSRGPQSIGGAGDGAGADSKLAGREQFSRNSRAATHLQRGPCLDKGLAGLRALVMIHRGEPVGADKRVVWQRRSVCANRITRVRANLAQAANLVRVKVLTRQPLDDK
jgi:hypothetical protein